MVQIHQYPPPNKPAHVAGFSNGRYNSMPLPHESYQQQVNPHSASSTVMGMGYETAKYATWRNPWFLERIGTSGWDPKGKGSMSWLDRKTGGMVNRMLAPDAGQFYGQLDKSAGRTIKAAYGETRRNMPSSVSTKGMDYVQSHSAGINYSTAKQVAVDKGVVKGTRVHNKIAGRMGLSPNDLAHLQTTDRQAVRGIARGVFGRSLNATELKAGEYTAGRLASGTAGKYAAGVHGVGKMLRGANVALWFYEAGKVAMGGFKAVAAVGAQSRFTPHATTGSGIQDSYMASTLRQSSLMDMYSSEYGNRRHMGNEAKFLHS